MGTYSGHAIYNGLLQNDEQVIQYVFYNHFNALLHHNAYKTCGNKNIDFEDLIQELYLYISKNNWEKLRKYNPEMPFENWFSVVSYRFFKDFTASMIDSSRNLPIENMEERSLLFQQNQIEKMMAEDIKKAIGKVTPPRNAQILKALIVDEEDPATVAERFDVTVDNLYNIKRRALAKLIKEQLQEYVTK
ncbi:MAG: sigma-70 family RNA polymerase sigma factor [Bacteroidales bacterium]|nr:sigma-70 family RNA polymerase sigma factor [Bacteroidales bacterium]